MTPAIAGATITADEEVPPISAFAEASWARGTTSGSSAVLTHLRIG